MKRNWSSISASLNSFTLAHRSNVFLKQWFALGDLKFVINLLR